MKRNPTPFYVINEVMAGKKFDKYNVMDYFIARIKNMPKAKRPKTIEECKEFIKREGMYQFWARCEYEILISAWPPFDPPEYDKWDVYRQIEMNIDIIAKILFENIQ